jgi:hypothetical protein
LNKDFARCFVMPGSVIIVVLHRYLPRTKRETRGAGLRNAADQGRKKVKMQKTILTIAGAALIALSTVQLAAASEHQNRTHHRATANAQFRHSNAYAAPASVAVQPAWSGYNYSGGNSAPAGH